MDKIELPPDWKVVKLGEISKDIQSGGTPYRKKPEFYGGSISWIKTLDLNENIVTKTEEKITQAGFESIRGKIRPINTVMVAMYGGKGTVGKSGILGIPATTNQAVCCIEPNPNKFDSFYLLYYLIYFRPIWMRYAIGTRKDPNISKGIVERTEVPLPPLPEQKSIAHTLRTIQKAKETRQRELELERERKAALMEYLFTHGTRNEARKQTEIGEIPESWEVVKLSQVAKKIFGGGTPSTKQDNFWDGCIPWTTTAIFHEDDIYLTKYQRNITEEGLQNSSTKIAPKGSVLIGTRVGVGKAVIATFDVAINQDITVLIPNNNLLPDFFVLSMKTYVINTWLSNRKRGTTIKGIPRGDVLNLPTFLPDISEQKEIAHILKSCDTKIQALEKEISLTDELFHATLEELMTGKLSTKNLIAQ
ncbi:restriction endonuclease subunit S [Cuspidothrix issatschenkoi LEGE 03284]|uniref:restriction endonuclease subunit S n=1 Tax=Cuspidothrix issatschenkoi TaxID=230752 RepID=UPI00187F683A|nr:restriction endonuclease subunit S [Cuspidothrix issatschenkoi]MBE9230160.1 restriction endonuclease subunit S [Cuspidothrix issatschenkoi LEGE 03284]